MPPPPRPPRNTHPHIPDAEPTELKYLAEATKFHFHHLPDGDKFNGSPRTALTSAASSAAVFPKPSLSSLSPHLSSFSSAAAASPTACSSPAMPAVSRPPSCPPYPGHGASTRSMMSTSDSHGGSGLHEAIYQRQLEGDGSEPLLGPGIALPTSYLSRTSAAKQSSHGPGPQSRPVAFHSLDDSVFNSGRGPVRLYFHLVGFLRGLSTPLALLTVLHFHAYIGTLIWRPGVRALLAGLWLGALGWNALCLVTVGLTLRLHPLRGSYGDDLHWSFFAGDPITDVLPPCRLEWRGRPLVLLGCGRQDGTDDCRPGRPFRLAMSAVDMAIAVLLNVSTVVASGESGSCSNCHVRTTTLGFSVTLCIIQYAIALMQPFDAFGPKWVTMNVNAHNVRARLGEKNAQGYLPL